MSGKEALFDSNIFVYISQKKLDFDKLIQNYDFFHSSIISYMEVMGYNFTDSREKLIVENLFHEFNIINIDNEIAESVIEIRKKKKIKLPDAIVYATASCYGLDLITRNENDFVNIDDTVRIINPFR